MQPTGRLELNAKTADLASSAWLGRATRDFSDVDVAEAVDELATRLGWAATKIEPAARAATRRCCRPVPIADLMIYAYWTANARDAEEGRNVFARRRRHDQDRAADWLNSRSLLRQIRCTRVWRPCPFVDFTSSGDDTSWAFDGGLPIDETTWIRTGCCTS